MFKTIISFMTEVDAHMRLYLTWSFDLTTSVTCIDSASFCAVSAAVCAALTDPSRAENSALASSTKPRCKRSWRPQRRVSALAFAACTREKQA